MPKKKALPHDLTWTLREVLEPGTAIRALSCQAGRTVVGGDGLFRLLPGKWTVQRRPLPSGIGSLGSIAVEPRSPFRVAVGPETGDVLVFADTINARSIIGHVFGERRGVKRAMQLMWVRSDEHSWLFARTDDLELHRMQPDGWDTLDLPPVHAIAQDEEGGFAALTVVDGKPKVYTTYDGGETWHLRLLGVALEVEPNAPAALALAGPTLAVIVGDSGPLVSRGLDQPTTRPTGLERAYALAFQGSDPDASLYVALARTEGEPAGVSLVGDDGSVLRVMDFAAADETPFDIGPIAWDGARQALMVGSRAGLMALSPGIPKPAAAKKKPARKAVAKKMPA